MIYKTIRTTLPIFLFLLLLFSCVTRNTAFSSVDELVRSGNYREAYDILVENKEDIYSDKDEVLFYLDSGALALHGRDMEHALAQLTMADNLMSELRKVNIGEQIQASIINDSLITYRGANYEYVFTSMMLSLGYLLQNKFDSGFVEIRRTQDKLDKIQVDNNIFVSEYNKNQNAYVEIDPILVPFVDSAFARLLSFWLYRADLDITNMEVAARKYEDAIVAQPDIYTFAPPQIEDEHYDTQNARIQIVALTGRTPIYYERNFALNGTSNGILISGWSEARNLPDDVIPVDQPNIFEDVGIIPIPGNLEGVSIVAGVPALAKIEDHINTIEVWSDEEKLGVLSLTEDLEEIAVQSFYEESKYIYARQISRVIFKTLLGVAANEVDPILGLIAQVFNNLTERADLRISRYLPGKIWTGDFKASDSGTHSLTLKYMEDAVVRKISTHTVQILKENDIFNLVVDSY